MATMSNNHVSVRLDAETMARVETLAPLFSTRWRRATRSDIFRALILTALECYERGQAALPLLEGSAPTAEPREAPRARRARSPQPRPGVLPPAEVAVAPPTRGRPRRLPR